MPNAPQRTILKTAFARQRFQNLIFVLDFILFYVIFEGKSRLLFTCKIHDLTKTEKNEK